MGAWPKELPGVLWANRTTARTPTREIPFKLAFETKAMILVEVGMSSLRRTYYDDHSNDEELRLSLDCLSEIRDDATQRMALYHQKMSKYHDQKVKLRRFNLGDMVLQKVSQATKDPT